ncbi:MAG: glutamyl-tRNA reductase, partial [Planctomycetota bacterium]
LDRALRIVDGEIESFQASLALQQSGPVIGRLEREYDRIMQQELEWLLPQLNGMPEEQKEKIRYFAHRLKNKFLHPPKAALRAEAKTGTPHGLIEAMRRLFGLQEDGS